MDNTTATTGEWFASVLFLARLVRRAARTPTRGLERLLEEAGCTEVQPWPQRAGASIERLGVEQRTAVLDSVGRLMGLGAEGLRQAVREAGLSRQGWCEHGDSVPEPLAKTVPALPDSAVAGTKAQRRRRTIGPRPRHEVLQMMARLKHRHGASPQ